MHTRKKFRQAISFLKWVGVSALLTMPCFMHKIAKWVYFSKKSISTCQQRSKTLQFRSNWFMNLHGRITRDIHAHMHATCDLSAFWHVFSWLCYNCTKFAKITQNRPETAKRCHKKHLNHFYASTRDCRTVWSSYLCRRTTSEAFVKPFSGAKSRFW